MGHQLAHAGEVVFGPGHQRLGHACDPGGEPGDRQGQALRVPGGAGRLCPWLGDRAPPWIERSISCTMARPLGACHVRRALSGLRFACQVRIGEALLYPAGLALQLHRRTRLWDVGVTEDGPLRRRDLHGHGLPNGERHSALRSPRRVQKLDPCQRALGAAESLEGRIVLRAFGERQWAFGGVRLRDRAARNGVGVWGPPGLFRRPPLRRPRPPSAPTTRSSRRAAAGADHREQAHVLRRGGRHVPTRGRGPRYRGDDRGGAQPEHQLRGLVHRAAL
mmetsp:Transcript_132984/g.315164  ORF Transcript_132984/g.315164 Transcript_132984/m.315164 type:complete len:277 (+) Transcript_132984:313-1143(+)